MLIIPTEKRFDWKHAPVVLFVLVLLNVIVFFGYQFGDDQKVFKALINYKNQNFLEVEWPIYRNYLKANGENERLQADQELYNYRQQPQNDFSLLYNIVSDNDFYNHLDANSYNLFSLNYLEKWALPRLKINNQIRSISSLSFGLIPKKMDVVSLFSYQFLHGGIMHLLGNMFFLIICGFAVEAAIGHLRFLLFYLASGLAGGLLFALLDLSSLRPLIGASGAVSGVMAMYLGVFRFKKIEFFYWFFVFVGYFRAPALLILPFYIGKELYSFFSDSGSNVAFMAHTGGFIAGGVLMALTYYFQSEVLNEKYIEEDQDLPKLQKDLDKVHGFISKSRFASASKNLDAIIEEQGINFDWAILKYNLLKMQAHPQAENALLKLISMNKLKPHEVDKLVKIWEEDINQKMVIDSASLYKFAWNLSTNVHCETAEQIFNQLNDLSNKYHTLGMLAKKLSVVYGKLNDNDKRAHYELLSSQLIRGKA